MVLLNDVAVLIVDDHRDARESVAAMLASRGAEVATAASAEEARAKLRAFRAHVVVSDLLMPKEDGYELLKSVRAASAEAPPVPFVALSAFGSPADRRRAESAGFRAFVKKPASGEYIAATIRLALAAAHFDRSATAPAIDEPAVDPNIYAVSPRAEPSGVHPTRAVTRLMNLALMTFHRSPSGVVHVENPGGKVMALFEPYLQAGKEHWRLIHVPSGLPAEDAQFLFLDWLRDDGRCD